MSPGSDSAPTVLVIDRDPSILHTLQQALREPEVRVLLASTGSEGLRLAAERLPHVVLVDLELPDLSGVNLFRRIHESDARVPIIYLTSRGSADGAIEAIKQGAYDYLVKPLSLARLRETLDSALQVSRVLHAPQVQEVSSAPRSSDILIGNCPAMQEVYKAIGWVAQQNVNVLILGESGTGKELVAHAIYQHSQRSDRPFLAINCAAIPETLLESELFGHEKGAFTGADRRRIGKFEQCNGGTLFLDEVGDMSPLTQAKMLRLLQEQAFERVGGNETIRTSVRVIAATHRDLARLVEEGTFRADLYYRLSVFSLLLPALRERTEDLPLLVDYFLERYSKELGKEVSRISSQALDILHEQPWLGNIRELQSVLKQSLLRARGTVLLPEFLPASLRDRVPQGPAAGCVPAASPTAPPSALGDFIQERLDAGCGRLYQEFQTETERQLFSQVMAYTGGNQLRAARLLGITRGKLRSKLRLLGLPAGRSDWLPEDHSMPPTGTA